MSQTDLANQLNTSVSVISRYERDEMTPSIDVAKKLAEILNTIVGYLLDETDQENVLKDPDMLKRLNDIDKISPTEKDYLLFALDALIQKIKIKNIAALKITKPGRPGFCLYLALLSTIYLLLKSAVLITVILRQS